MDKFFGLKENNTTVKTEIIAGITTFITMAYIIFVNPDILSTPLFIMKDKNAAIMKDSIFVATCIAAAIGTLIMGLYAKLPFAQAPGMGLNAFFAFTIVLGMGYTFNQGLAAVFISGILFIIITLIGLREAIVKAIPQNIKYAITAGIGLFISLIGLVNAKIVINNDVTLVQLVDFSKFASTEVYDQVSGMTYGMATKNAIVAIIGLVIIGILMAIRVKGAILLGILATTIVGIPFGVTNLAGFNKIVDLPPSVMPTFFKMDFLGLLGLDGKGFVSAIFATLTVVISFSLVDMFDTIGTLIGTGQKAGLIDEHGRLPRMEKALMADAVASSVGACLGTSTVTTYVESGAGVAEGGKTGLTAVTTGVLFLAALFFAPLVGIVPSAATAPALIIVGVLMMSSVKHINFNDFEEALPAFLTMAMMPFTYSIATGIAAGLIIYPIAKIATGKAKEVHPIVYVLAVLFILRFSILPH
ncbi:MAG: adenine/guanine/hypoxanthine permease [Clostridiales bacterium]|jgi:AGZA family xanthine/uracil permease-like MFS transporter|nr:adenine/guanine/hypoxanthine permease [Clostridiales bacterium]MDK2934851.1 adenine/guanine/hypoxanthine permease [Clostridiales bacterium]